MFQSEENFHDKRIQDKKRTIYIDTVGVSMLDFNLSREKMQSLIYSGFTAANKYCNGLKDSSQNFVLSSYLLGSLLEVYSGNIELNAEFKFHKSRLNYDSPRLPKIITKFYSRGSDKEITFFKKLNINLASKDSFGENVFHLAAKSKDNSDYLKRVFENNRDIDFGQFDIENHNGEYVLDLVSRIPDEREKINLAKIFIDKRFKHTKLDNAWIKASPVLRHEFGKILDEF